MKMQRKRTILAVDDDEINLMILSKGVQEAGYDVRAFNSGEQAWEFLQHNAEEVDIALVDKMMPGVSGLELLKRIKNNASLKHIPVIIQTGDVGVTQMREGLETGAYYYLTKPFHPDILTAILHSVENECAIREELLGQMSGGHVKFMTMLQEGEFVLRTHAEARLLAAAISQAATYPEFVALGLMELFSNAIEHGNLDIGYDHKHKFLMAGTWAQELARRAESKEYRDKIVRVRMDRTVQGLHMSIADEGKGFDWQHYLNEDDTQGSLNKPNGRGIAKAAIMLDNLRYNGAGNEVHCNISMPASISMPSQSGVSLGLRHN